MRKLIIGTLMLIGLGLAVISIHDMLEYEGTRLYCKAWYNKVLRPECR